VSRVKPSSDLITIVVIIGVIIVLAAVSELLKFINNNPLSTVFVSITISLIGLFLIVVFFYPSLGAKILSRIGK